MRVLLLRLEGPMMSFGGAMVDKYGPINAFPGLSMLTGLLGNALGFEHGDSARLQSLQDRLHYASRADEPGRQLRDYHTVDLGQDFLSSKHAWTTRHRLETRAGGNSTTTHIRYRDYWVDALHVVALSLDRADVAPTVDDLGEALRRPARPLFLGRKTCLPSMPLWWGVVEASDPLAALERLPKLRQGVAASPPELVDGARDDDGTPVSMWFEARDVALDAARPYVDARDWRNQVHVGERWIASKRHRIPSAGGER